MGKVIKYKIVVFAIWGTYIITVNIFKFEDLERRYKVYKRKRKEEKDKYVLICVLINNTIEDLNFPCMIKISYLNNNFHEVPI